MWHWIALLPSSASEPDVAAPALPSLQRQLGWWALQFTPRVAWLEDAVVLEVTASERLFGGAQALRERIQREARQMASAQGEAVLRSAHAPTALGALALAKKPRALTPRAFAEGHSWRACTLQFLQNIVVEPDPG